LVQELIQRGLCTIFLPWQVLQELDRHKSGLETAVQARSVVRWISRLLEANQALPLKVFVISGEP